LHFGQHLARFGDMPLQGRQALLEWFEIAPQPNGSNAGGENKDAAFAQLIGYPYLTEGRLLQREGGNR